MSDLLLKNELTLLARCWLCNQLIPFNWILKKFLIPHWRLMNFNAGKLTQKTLCLSLVKKLSKQQKSLHQELPSISAMKQPKTYSSDTNYSLKIIHKYASMATCRVILNLNFIWGTYLTKQEMNHLNKSNLRPQISWRTKHTAKLRRIPSQFWRLMYLTRFMKVNMSYSFMWHEPKSTNGLNKCLTSPVGREMILESIKLMVKWLRLLL